MTPIENDRTNTIGHAATPIVIICENIDETRTGRFINGPTKIQNSDSNNKVKQ